jgi:hypothetical protein
MPMPAQSSPDGDMPPPPRQDGDINETNGASPSSGIQSPSPSQLIALSPPVRSSGPSSASSPSQKSLPVSSSLAAPPLVPTHQERGDMAADALPQQPKRESLGRSPASTESMRTISSRQNPSPSASTSDLKDRRSSDRNRFSFSSLYSLGSTLYTGGPDKNSATTGGSAVDESMKPASGSLGSPSTNHTELSPAVASPVSGSTGK